uniref:WD_REPEATS_REGION domain-containing protein n=1 Tax=Ditylenchus dipsaci TaxID=166011 RepID=A0A915CN11_9BILA
MTSSQTPMAISSGLVVQLSYGQETPRNQISHVSCLLNGRIIVTGTTEGQVIHYSCISPCSLSSTSTKYLTCSQDGHICLWDSQDGRVVESVRGNYVHRMIIPHSSSTSTPPQPSDNFLFVLVTMLKLLWWMLSSRVEPDWINTMTIVHPSDKHDVVIGVSVSGMIKLWSLNDLDKRDPGHVIYEDESKTMTSQNVQFIACSHLNTRMMLVICTNSWQIVDPSNLKQLIISECAIEGIQGCIIDIDRVAIGFADSTIVLFQLPRSKLVGKQIRERFGDSPTNIGNIDQPFVFALVKGISTSPTTPLWSTVQFHFDTRTSSDGRRRRVAYRVDQHGSLSVWHIPKNYDLLVNEFIRSRKPVVYEPTIRQSFAEVWNRLNPSPPNISGTDDDHFITATVYVGNQNKLFFGREDGSILMMNACHAIMNQLLDNPNIENINHRVLCGHSAAVNCFLYPYEDSPRYDSQILLSGGADFAVVVWNITTGLKLHRFCCQGGPVLRMLVPPPNCNPRVLHTICAIAGDNSASLLSLKENKCVLLASRQQFPIIDVKWRPLDDFMLLRCEDDSVYVWEIETCNLDRIVTGLITEDVMEACKEQIGLMDAEDEAGASQAVQMFRALKNKNVAVIKKIAAHGDDKNTNADMFSTSTGLLPPMDVVQLKNVLIKLILCYSM